MTMRSSGYLNAVQTVSFSGTQTLNSLLQSEWTDLSDEVDNSANLYPMADWELQLGSAAFTGADSLVAFYIVPTMDGTNYPDWAGNVTSGGQQQYSYHAGVFITSGTTAAQRLYLPNIPMPPGRFKVGFRNFSGVTLASSGNTLRYRAHSFQDI